MLSVTSRIWTRVTVSISYDDNHYTKDTSKIYIDCFSNMLGVSENRYNFVINSCFVQSAGPVEYTDCTSAEGHDSPHQRVSWYDTKQSDGEVPVMLELWGMRITLSLP